MRREIHGESGALAKLDPRLAGIPSDFLKYVSAGGPGHRLPRARNIYRYLVAGEETSFSRLAESMGNVIQELGELREQMLRAVVDDGPGSEVASQLSRVTEPVTGAGKSRRGRTILSAAMAALRDLERLLDEVPLVRGRVELRDRWNQRIDSAVAQAIDDVVRNAS